MRVILSILLSISMLAGSVGISWLNSSCDCCQGELVCQCISGCETAAVEEAEPVQSCCSMDHEEENQDKKESCSSDCCTHEYFKLDVPLALTFVIIKVEIPKVDIPFSYAVSVHDYFHLRAANSISKIPDKPPILTRSGLDLFSTFLC